MPKSSSRRAGPVGRVHQHQVARGDVAVHDAAGVGHRDGLHHRLEQSQRLVAVEAPSLPPTLGDDGLQRHAVEPVEDHVRRGVAPRRLGHAEVEDAHHGRVIEPRDDARLLREALAKHGPRHVAVLRGHLEHLHRHVAVERAVVALVHAPEAALGDEALDADARVEPGDLRQRILAGSGLHPLMGARSVPCVKHNCRAARRPQPARIRAAVDSARRTTSLMPTPWYALPMA
jgi:hypothetical protein